MISEYMKGFSIIVLCTIVIYILIVMLDGKNIISKIVTGLIVFLRDTYILMLLAKVISLFGKYYFISWVIGIFFCVGIQIVVVLVLSDLMLPDN